MANITPAFVTGANARVMIGSKTLAFCNNVNYNIDVATIPVEAIGKYEVFTNEPVAFTVNGSFDVIRYTSSAAASNVPGISSTTHGDNTEQLGISKQLNPALMLSSTTFDLEIHNSFAVSGTTTAANFNNLFKITDCRVTRRSSTLNKRQILTDSYSFVAILAGDTDVAGENAFIGSSGTVGTTVV